MGIKGLSSDLEKSGRKCNVSEFSGSTIAVDSSCWLHRGAICCASKLVMGEETTAYLGFALKMIALLRRFNIRIIMVFDGLPFQPKQNTSAKRAATRTAAKTKALDQLRCGDKFKAEKLFMGAIKITQEMTLALRRKCHELNVDCIVAPFEADAQLAYFSLTGVADYVISEDSDLMVFGCKKVIYKIDLAGWGILVEDENLAKVVGLNPKDFTLTKFRHIAILAGCDYLESLPGVGIKKAAKFIQMTAETNPDKFLDRVPAYLNLKKAVVSTEYKAGFLIADEAFQYQLIFDPYQRKRQPLNQCNDNNTVESVTNFDLLQFAVGNLDIKTLKIINSFNVDSIIDPRSIWKSKKQSKHQSAFETGTKKDVHTSVNSQKEVQSNCFNSQTSKLTTKPVVKKSDDNNSTKPDNNIENEIECYFNRKVALTKDETPQIPVETKFVAAIVKPNPFSTSRLKNLKTKRPQCEDEDTDGPKNVVLSVYFHKEAVTENSPGDEVEHKSISPDSSPIIERNKFNPNFSKKFESLLFDDHCELNIAPKAKKFKHNREKLKPRQTTLDIFLKTNKQ